MNIECKTTVDSRQIMRVGALRKLVETINHLNTEVAFMFCLREFINISKLLLFFSCVKGTLANYNFFSVLMIASIS